MWFSGYLDLTWWQLVLVALVLGFWADGPYGALLCLVLVYAITVPADSGSLTSGMSGSADPRFRGVTMALHSTVGFGLSALAEIGRAHV